jgi:hypothetical protein
MLSLHYVPLVASLLAPISQAPAEETVDPRVQTLPLAMRDRVVTTIVIFNSIPPPPDLNAVLDMELDEGSKIQLAESVRSLRQMESSVKRSHDDFRKAVEAYAPDLLEDYDTAYARVMGMLRDTILLIELAVGSDSPDVEKEFAPRRLPDMPPAPSVSFDLD